MIVLFGYGDDRALELVAEASAKASVDCTLVDQKRPVGCELLLEVTDGEVGGQIIVNGGQLSLADVHGIYGRPLSPVLGADPSIYLKGQALHDAFIDWMDITDARVVSRPSAMHSNCSKPFQAQLIAAAGFTVPETLITNDPDLALAFWHRHEEVIFKSVSSVRSIVRKLDAFTAARIGRIRSLPTQFQELVPGLDVRVHVVGREVFATGIETGGASDYRYVSREGATAELFEMQLPDAVAVSCVTLAEHLGLAFCGIDFRRKPDGSYVCFEVNPMPGFSFYERETDQPISHTLVKYLDGR